MYTIDFANFVEEKCYSIKLNVEELLNSLPFKERINLTTPSDKLTVYRKQIDSLNEELTRMKLENALLNEEKNQLISNQRSGLLSALSSIQIEIHDIRGIFFGEEINVKPFQKRIHEIIKKIVNLSGSIAYLKDVVEIKDIYQTIEGEYFVPTCSLSDGRLVSIGNQIGSISVCSIDYGCKTWKQDIIKENAHYDHIFSFMELSNHRLISCSKDCSIKVWNVLPSKLEEIKLITGHNNIVYKVIPLGFNKFASGSGDHTVKIWNNEKPYNLLRTIQAFNEVWNLLYLKHKEMLVVNCKGGLEFWELFTYSKEHTLENISAFCCINSMLELPNNKIALSTEPTREPFQLGDIYLIDVNDYSIIKQFRLLPSSLCLLNDQTIFYVFCGETVQILLENYFIINEKISKDENKLLGFSCISLDKGREYLIIQNNLKGFNIFKPYYITDFFIASFVDYLKKFKAEMNLEKICWLD